MTIFRFPMTVGTLKYKPLNKHAWGPTGWNEEPQTLTSTHTSSPIVHMPFYRNDVTNTFRKMLDQ